MWEKKQPKYMAVKPVLDAFEKQEGRLAGSRRRWPKYLDFLSQHPELAAWRGKEAEIAPLSPEESNLNLPEDRFDAFMKKNPEIKALDDLDFQWRVKKKFGTPPRRTTWTEPTLFKHPEWLTYQKAEGYEIENLDLPAHNLKLKVLTNTENGSKAEDYKFNFDPRLLRLRKKPNGNWEYQDPIPGVSCSAKVQGIKLKFKNLRGDKRKPECWDPYLHFSVEIKYPGEEREPLRPGSIPDGARILAIDFGQRTFAVYSVCRYHNGQPDKKPEAVHFIRIPGLDFDAIAKHEYAISLRMRHMYKAKGVKRISRHAPRGGKTFRELREHKQHMKEDLYKKGVSRIVQAALRHKVDAIVVEDLEKYRTQLERPSRENRRLMVWKIRHTVKFLKQTIEPLGIPVHEVNPAYTSYVCSACGSPGARFTVPTDEQWKRFYAARHKGNKKPIVVRGGEFFICSNKSCSRPGKVNKAGKRSKPRAIVQADVNASLNLHRVFAQTFKALPKDHNWKETAKVCQARLDCPEQAPEEIKTPW
jgi:IS605 OrfB family transposase